MGGFLFFVSWSSQCIIDWLFLLRAPLPHSKNMAMVKQTPAQATESRLHGSDLLAVSDLLFSCYGVFCSFFVETVSLWCCVFTVTLIDWSCRCSEIYRPFGFYFFLFMFCDQFFNIKVCPYVHSSAPSVPSDCRLWVFGEARQLNGHKFPQMSSNGMAMILNATQAFCSITVHCEVVVKELKLTLKKWVWKPTLFELSPLSS